MENNKTANRIAGICALPTQQRRLRHLRSLAARNIQLKRKRMTLDVTQLQMFFTLHTDPNSHPFYTSEKIRGSLNPVWKSFSLIHMNEDKTIDTTSQSLTVRVWYGQTCQSESDYDCCIRWVIHLSGLIYLGNKILNDRSQHPANTLIFGLQDGFYGAPAINKKEANVTAESKNFVVDADLSLIRESYSTRSLMRVQTVLRAIKQTQRGVSRERRAINTRLLELEHLRRKKAQRELALIKVNMTRSDLQWRITQLQGLETTHEMLQVENIQREVALRKKCGQLENDSEELHERKKRYFDVRDWVSQLHPILAEDFFTLLHRVTWLFHQPSTIQHRSFAVVTPTSWNRDELIKTGAQLVLRRKQLLSELAFIYPIQRLPNSVDRIAGVHLPHSEAFAGHDETQIAIALGYTCHLVLMISSFLDIPLRYPMDHRGSRSMIRDHIIDQLSEKERDFPLFSKGKEKFQFQYGVFILNKNTAELRHYCGMPTPDLRQTLANISTLLCDKLGVTINRNDAFTNQHSLIPPSFGGPQKSIQSQAVITTKEPSAPSVDATLRISQTDPRLEEIAEESGEFHERHANTLAVTSAAKNVDVREKPDFVATDHISDLPFPTANTDIKSKKLSFTDSNHCVADETKDGIATTSSSLIEEDLRLQVYLEAEDFQNPRLRDSMTSNTTGTPCVEDLDTSSTEDTDSLLYRSHFGQWDSVAAPEQAVEEQSLVGTGQENSNDNCDASFDSLLQQPSSDDALLGGADMDGVGRTFKTWNSTAKEWGNHWTHDETEDNGSVHSDKFLDNGSTDL